MKKGYVACNHQHVVAKNIQDWLSEKHSDFPWDQDFGIEDDFDEIALNYEIFEEAAYANNVAQIFLCGVECEDFIKDVFLTDEAMDRIHDQVMKIMIVSLKEKQRLQ